MKNIFLIAVHTLKEVQRHRVLYGLIALVFFIIGSSVLLGSLSLNEQARLSVNFIFTASHLSLITLAIFFSSQLISGEITGNASGLILFTKPLSRSQFILGKFFGMSFVLLFSALFLTSCIFVIHQIYKHPVSSLMFIAIWGVFLESLIVLCISFLLSCFMGSFLVLVCSIFIFIIGHCINGIVFFLPKVEESNSFLLWCLHKVLRLFPNFEKLNWRPEALYLQSLVKGELLLSSLYAILWIIVLLTMGVLFFERKQIA